MRANLCASLLHDPEILFLDEPTIGLDIVVKKQIREMICDINRKKNVTVILTTHDMNDIESTCQRIILIDKGKIIVDQPTKEIISQFKGDSSITVALDPTPDSFSVDNTESVELVDGRYVITFNHNKVTAAEIVSEIAQKYRIVD